MKLNKYGLKITGLKKLAGELQANLPKSGGEYSPKYFQINYNTETGEIWGDFFCSIGQNNWNEYHDLKIIEICKVNKVVTMQGIIDRVASKLNQLEYMENEGFGDGGIYGKATKDFFNRKGQQK